MTYKLRLIHAIGDCDWYFSILWKDFELPFVPWIGLQIYDGEAAFNSVGLEIKSMVWSVASSRFVATTPREIWGKKDNSPEDKKEVAEALASFIDSMLKDGWSDEDLD